MKKYTKSDIKCYISQIGRSYAKEVRVIYEPGKITVQERFNDKEVVFEGKTKKEVCLFLEGWWSGCVHGMRLHERLIKIHGPTLPWHEVRRYRKPTEEETQKARVTFS